jgi:hypothetical protein
MMLHLDFEVTDHLEAEAQRAIGLGAALSSFQSQVKVRVWPDPASHPFFLVTG